MLQPRDTAEVTGRDRLLVFLLAFAWGGNWIAVAIGVHGETPWSLRFLGSALGALTLIAAAWLTGHTLKVPRAERIHVMIAGFLNVACFQIFSAFAQLNGATSRVIILTYSMPIWTTIMSRFLLGERLNAVRRLAIALCAAGLAVLVWPLFAHGVPATVFLGLGCAIVWGGATVYLKWVKVTVPPLANAAWQLVFGFLFIAAGTFVFEGVPHVRGLTLETWAAILFMGVVGTGFAHFLWWSIAGRLSPITASIGSLMVPVVGVLGSVVLLNERPTLTDAAGFVLIFGAASCVLLMPALGGAKA
ncbi:MAG TPA: DMT family transporter [Pseudolabrys sp.]|nr:DMT family transporter [Pseudolabrys sp.]